jgi:hypothetical protein
MEGSAPQDAPGLKRQRQAPGAFWTRRKQEKQGTESVLASLSLVPFMARDSRAEKMGLFFCKTRFLAPKQRKAPKAPRRFASDLRKSEADLCKSEADLRRSEADLCKAEVNLRRSEVNLCRGEAKLCRGGPDLCGAGSTLYRAGRELGGATTGLHSFGQGTGARSPRLYVGRASRLHRAIPDSHRACGGLNLELGTWNSEL